MENPNPILSTEFTRVTLLLNQVQEYSLDGGPSRGVSLPAIPSRVITRLLILLLIAWGAHTTIPEREGTIRPHTIGMAPDAFISRFIPIRSVR